jgi:hypothetical protein
LRNPLRPMVRGASFTMGGGGRSHELRVSNISTMLGDLDRWCVV